MLCYESPCAPCYPISICDATMLRLRSACGGSPLFRCGFSKRCTNVFALDLFFDTVKDCLKVRVAFIDEFLGA